MNSGNSYGINEARPILGDLVTAAQQGTDIILTRNGRPVARLTAYTSEDAMTETRDRLIAAGVDPSLIETPGPLVPQGSLIVNGWTVRRWATGPDRWEVTPPNTSSHTGFGHDLSAADVVSIVQDRPPIMSGLRLNDGRTTPTA
ncbi:type II toxin-antitoxin system prevent-host-death family antitoxin [Dactylosporangium roseum]|uniref:Antitoxin n=1 Tax=Dactylosporangium roseum TaxID=47989 RepID=A0ABY5Z5Y6_9ACTN|nr:type II toxin-antitoxin system prevent-host-death family antitoxin [Dactylosporangium roseum]UWZ37465.1 type II toxin-antitoxin system prevent-host-death family antitoxin [Dactylosporangium roseum]